MCVINQSILILASKPSHFNLPLVNFVLRAALFQYHQNKNMALWACSPLTEVIMVTAIFAIYTKGHEFLIIWLKEIVCGQILYHEAIAIGRDTLLMPCFLLFKHT